MSGYAVTVTGATGKTGRHVVELARAIGWRVRAAVRREPDHAEWAWFDWDAEDSWSPAFAGSDAVYVVIPFRHPGAPERTPRLLEVAAGSGVARIVLLSTLDADGAPVDNPSRAAELTLEALPVRSAILRPTWFMDNFTVGAFAAMTATGDLRLPAGDGRIPFVDTRDVAAVAVAALGPDGPDGVLPLTGPEAISHHRVATALATALGRPVGYTPVAAGEFNALMTAQGFPLEYAEFLSAALTDVATGRLRISVTDTVQRVLGRRAYTLDDFAPHHINRMM